MVTPIKATRVGFHWPDVEPWLLKACKRTGDVESTDRLRRKCLAGKAALILIGDDAACVMEKEGDFAHITSLGGTGFLQHVPELIPVWKQIAGVIGCTGLSLKGRNGWERVLKPYGFKLNNGFLENTSWA
jgi:hypothetical protein